MSAVCRCAVALTVALGWTLPLWSQPGNLRQIVPGVWFRTGASLLMSGVDFRENSTIIEMKDYLVVIDSGTRNSVRGALADCRALSPKPVKYVFLTHYHFDHVEGNPIWTQAGATTLGFAALNEQLRGTNGRFDPPREVLPGNSFALDDGTRRLEFYHYGWAHTKGDSFAFLPKEKVLCTGDVVVNGPYNSTFESNLRNWPDVIRRLEALDPQFVLPGHGAPGSRELLRGQREYLETLIAEVRKAIQAGRKLEDLVEMKDGNIGASRLVLPAACDNWARSPISGRAVKDVYDQFSK